MENKQEKESNCKATRRSKKQNRWDSKRQKILAFLDIIESDENSSEISAKKLKLEKDAKISKPIEVDKIALRRKLRETKDKLGPEIILNTDGVNAQLNVGDGSVSNVLYPIFVKDIKSFVYLLTQKKIPYTRWCKIVRSHTVSQVVVLIVDCLSSNMYLDNLHCFPKINSLSFKLFEVIPPISYGISLIDDLCFAPLHHTNITHATVSRETNETVVTDETSTKKTVKQIFKVDLLLSPIQMVIENYPIPCDEYCKYRFTKMEYKSVCPSSPLYGLDCEMVLNVKDKLELVHISIVNENLEVVYDTYVQPKRPIKDYLTKFSGVTESTLIGVTTKLSDVQSYIQQLLPPDAILCGQSLNFDLHTLKMIHPYVIDTAVIYNLSGSRNRKASLKRLAKSFLGEDIQCNTDGHSPVEDSIAAVKLVLLKLQQGLEFGDATFDYLQGNLTALPTQINETDKKMLVIGDDLLLNWYSKRQLLQQVDLIKLHPNEFLFDKFTNSSDYNLTICSLNNDVTGTNENTKESIDKLDEVIYNLYELCKINALFVVVTDGMLKSNTHKYENGLCMMKIKSW